MKFVRLSVAGVLLLGAVFVPERSVAADHSRNSPSSPAAQLPEQIAFSSSGHPQLGGTGDGGSGQVILYTLDTALQRRAEQLLSQYRIPWGALVALDPKTGKVLALASYSRTSGLESEVATRATFPAASLFKIVTAAAAIERAGVRTQHTIAYRGGNYTLTEANYRPDARKDRRTMTVADALGKSCNPVFGRLGVKHLGARALDQYARNFGFNMPIPFDLPLQQSVFVAPRTDYDVARTAAGFGDVRISPLHAALLTGAIANGGRMMRPYVVERVLDQFGKTRYEGHSAELKRSVLPSTASELMRMMRFTTINGTARRHFSAGGLLRGIPVAGKTGTLRGSDPKGLYHWFVAAAPETNPEIVIAALVVENGPTRIKAVPLGKLLLEDYFTERYRLPPARTSSQVRVAHRNTTTRRKRRVS